jgi:hypothetical protein
MSTIKVSFSAALLLLMISVLVQAQRPTTLTPQQLENIIREIDPLISGVGAGSPIQIRKLLRAAFHDCTQGCDARINLETTANRGFESFVREMDRVYYDTQSSLFFDTLTRADFWALCFNRALGLAIKAGADRDNSHPSLGAAFVPYLYGRSDNDFFSAVDDN